MPAIIVKSTYFNYEIIFKNQLVFCVVMFFKYYYWFF
jgi:hypothetical protein